MKVLWVLFDGGGNIPPQMGTAKTLRERGVQVHMLGYSGIRERAENEGFSFEEFGGGCRFDPCAPRSLASMMIDFAKVTADRRVARCIVDTARRIGTDAVVVDIVFAAGIAELMREQIPTVAFVHFFYRAAQDMASSPVGMFLRMRGITPLGAEHGDVLQIVCAREELDPVRGAPPVRHVGVVWQGAPSQAVRAARPRILVSLSTCAYSGQERMLQNILDAVEPLPVDAVVTVGPGIGAKRLRVPRNAAVHDWLDHDEVLPTASLVVGHGGHSTAMRALSFGVPVVVLPANPMIDQKGVGAAIERAGAGRLLRKHSRVQTIRRAIDDVLNTASYHLAASRLGEQIRERDGAVVAADAIEDYVGTHAGVGGPLRSS